jgi:RimJ/RimL family protein N-acetyltransferase
MTEIIEFKTDRLFLRQWRQEDRAPFARLNADPEVMAWFPDLLDRQASDALMDRCQALIEERGWGFWAVEIRGSGEFLGFVGLHVPVQALPFSPCVEIGWRLAKAYWGRGLACEAAQGALRVGFDTLGLQEIVSFTALLNLRSQRLMQRLGMRREASTFEHPLVPQGHPLREHCLYRLKQAAWMKRVIERVQ